MGSGAQTALGAVSWGPRTVFVRGGRRSGIIFNAHACLGLGPYHDAVLSYEARGSEWYHSASRHRKPQSPTGARSSGGELSGVKAQQDEVGFSISRLCNALKCSWEEMGSIIHAALTRKAWGQATCPSCLKSWLVSMAEVFDPGTHQPPELFSEPSLQAGRAHRT